MKQIKAGFGRIRLFGFFRLAVLGLLAYISVVAMFATQSPPYGTLRAIYDSARQGENSQDAEYWISQLRSGEGLFLHVRHAARMDSIDIGGFDYWELASAGRSAVVEDYVCLTEEGKAQAALLGLALEQLNIPFFVVSSPSCRARETATISALRIDLVDISAIYESAIPKQQKSSFIQGRLNFFDSHDFHGGATTIIFGHEALPYADAEWVVREDGEIRRLQGGISIMSYDSVQKEATVHYTFERIQDLVMAVF